MVKPGVGWPTLVIPAHRRWRQEDQEFKFILSYIGSLGKPGIQETSDSKKKKVKNRGRDGSGVKRTGCS